MNASLPGIAQAMAGLRPRMYLAFADDAGNAAAGHAGAGQ